MLDYSGCSYAFTNPEEEETALGEKWVFTPADEVYIPQEDTPCWKASEREGTVGRVFGEDVAARL